MANRTWSESKTKVSIFVEDTDTTFLGYIGDWLNDRYQDVWNRTNWSAAINNDYTFELVASQATYDLPDDFEREIFVANIQDGQELKRYTEPMWWKERSPDYNADTITTSAYPENYIILKEALNTTHTGFGKIQIDPAPTATKTIAMPYKRKFTRLVSVSEECTTDTANKVIASAGTFITDKIEKGMVIKNTTDNTYGYVVSVDSETQITADWDICPDGNEAVTIQNLVVIPNIDYILEYGAIAEALAYKKFYQKADYYNMKYETELVKRIGMEKTQINQDYQRIPRTDARRVYRLTGDLSYDSIP